MILFGVLLMISFLVVGSIQPGGGGGGGGECRRRLAPHGPATIVTPHTPLTHHHIKVREGADSGHAPVDVEH